MGAKLWKENEALEAIKVILEETCGTDPTRVQREAKLVEDLNVDSLGMLEAVIESEEVFGVSIDAAELSSNLTIGGLIDTIRKKGIIDQ